jgi:hypothetical protein
MAEPSAFKFDEAKFTGKIEKQILFLQTFAGKPLHNPFPSIEKAKAMLATYNAGDRSKELYESAMALAETAPVICKQQEVSAETVSKEMLKAQAGALSSNK